MIVLNIILVIILLIGLAILGLYLMYNDYLDLIGVLILIGSVVSIIFFCIYAFSKDEGSYMAENKEIGIVRSVEADNGIVFHYIETESQNRIPIIDENSKRQRKAFFRNAGVPKGGKYIIYNAKNLKVGDKVVVYYEKGTFLKLKVKQRTSIFRSQQKSLDLDILSDGEISFEIPNTQKPEKQKTQ